MRHNENNHTGCCKLLDQMAYPHHRIVVKAAGGFIKIDDRTVLDNTYITDDMRRTAANIDRIIGKAALQEDTLVLEQETALAAAEKPRMTDFKPYVGRKRKYGIGCISEINDHLFKGRGSPK